MIILNNTIAPINKLYHISDIHIRLFKRHTEYEQVFDLLYNTLQQYKKKDNNGLIVLTGDIVHAKLDMSPELVKLTSSFFSSLCNIFPVILIPGNHDLNLSNRNRLDCLTPIVDNLNNPNIHYLKSSDIYQYSNIRFYNYSVMDDNWQFPPVDKQFVNVGLYHGLLYGATTDTDLKITTDFTNASYISLFNGLDMVLLGDIHKYQVLTEKNEINNPLVPTSAYASSLIQQNFGETITDHGFIVWDVPTCTLKYEPIPNPYAYVTIHIKDDIVASIPLPKYVKNIRVRIITENTKHVTIRKLESELRKKYNVLEVIVLSNNSINSFTSNSVITNITNVSEQNKLITEFMKHLSEDKIQNITNLNTKLNQQLDIDTIPRCLTWKPIYIKFDNLFSYGSDNYINFESLDGLNGLFAPNASGKTSMIDAICFALYDKTPRAFKGNHIMNANATSCQCEFVLQISDVLYKIERIGVKKKNGDVKFEVNFFEKKSDAWASLNGDDRRNTNAIIRSYIGEYEDFILTTMSSQNQDGLFVNLGQTDRKEILAQFLGLTIFDRLTSIANEELKELELEKKSLNLQILPQQMDQTFKNIEILKVDVDNVKNELDAVRFKLEKDQHEVIKLQATKPIIEELDNTIDINSIQTNKLKTLEHIEITTQEIEKHKAVIEEQITQSKILEQKIKEFENIEELYNNEYTAIKNDVDKFTISINDSKQKMEELNKKIENLAAHKYDPECKFCIDNIFVKDAIEAKKQWAHHEAGINLYNITLEHKQKILYDLQYVKDQYEELILNRQIHITLINDIKISKMTLDSHKIKLLELTSKLEKFNSIIQIYENNIENIVIIKQIDDIIVKLTEQINKNKLTLKKIEDEYTFKKVSLETNCIQYQTLQDKLTKSEELDSSILIYEWYIEAMGKNGLQYNIILSLIPMMGSSINLLLEQVVDFKINMEMNDKYIDIFIVYDDNRKWPLELASGMEKFVSGLCIRMALMSISSLPKPNFLIIDEGLGVLDADNLNSIFSLFDMLKANLDFIILISHLDVVRDITDNLLTITKINNLSHINLP